MGVGVRTGLLLEFGWYLVCDLFDYDDDDDDDDDEMTTITKQTRLEVVAMEKEEVELTERE